MTFLSCCITVLLVLVYAQNGLFGAMALVSIPVLLVYFYFCIRDPYYVLPLLLISTSINMYGRLIEGSLYTLSVFHLAALLFLVSFVINKLNSKTISLTFPPVVFPIFILYLMMFVSTSYSPFPMVALINFIRMFLLFLMSILIFNITITPKRLYILFIILTVNIVLVSSYNLYEFSKIPVKQFVLEQLNPVHSITRTGANFDNINNFAILIATSIVTIFCITFVSRIRWVYKIGLLLLSITIWMSLITTFTRSVPAIIIVSLIIIYFFSPYRKGFHILLAVSGFFLIILYFNLGFIKTYLDRILAMVLGNYDDSISTRGHLLRQGFQIGLDNFFFGVGLEGFTHYYYPRIPFTQLNWEIVASHNILITLFAELGFLGPIFYLIIFYQFIKTHLKQLHTMTTSLYKSLYLSSFLIVLMYFQFFLFNTPYFDDNSFWIFWGISFLYWKSLQSDQLHSITEK